MWAWMYYIKFWSGWGTSDLHHLLLLVYNNYFVRARMRVGVCVI